LAVGTVPKMTYNVLGLYSTLLPHKIIVTAPADFHYTTSEVEHLISRRWREQEDQKVKPSPRRGREYITVVICDTEDWH